MFNRDETIGGLSTALPRVLFMLAGVCYELPGPVGLEPDGMAQRDLARSAEVAGRSGYADCLERHFGCAHCQARFGLPRRCQAALRGQI
jgi:hypothetical protein